MAVPPLKRSGVQLGGPRRLARIVATIAGAGLLTLLVPPRNWHLLHWVVYLPMFWALRADSPRANQGLALLYGTTAVGALFWWIVPTIVTFSPGFWFVAALGVLLLFSVVFGLPYVALWSMVHPLRQRLGTGWVLALPALQVVIEWVGTYLLLFPYNHGVTQYRVPQVWQLASVTGIWGITYLLFLVNSVLAEVIYRSREGRRAPVTLLSGTAAAVALVVLFGSWRYERVEAQLRDADVVRIAQIQSAEGMIERMRRSPRQELAQWVRRTRQLPGGTDLVVWPEGAVPYDLSAEEGSRAAPRRRLEALAGQVGAELVVGGGSMVRRKVDGHTEYVLYNSVFHIREEGVAGRYDKMVPLPFGEQMPLGDWFPDVRRSLGIGDFEAGHVPVVFEGDVAQIASPICYEAILTRVCRQFADVELFVTITNDAWFGDTAAPHEHAMLAAVRAVELGVPMFRTAYTGVSVVVEPHGAWHYETEPFTDVARVVEVRVGQLDTLYGRLGDWFVWACLAGLGGAWWRSARRSRRFAPAGG